MESLILEQIKKGICFMVSIGMVGLLYLLASKQIGIMVNDVYSFFIYIYIILQI